MLRRAFRNTGWSISWTVWLKSIPTQVAAPVKLFALPTGIRHCPFLLGLRAVLPLATSWVWSGDPEPCRWTIRVERQGDGFSNEKPHITQSRQRHDYR